MGRKVIGSPQEGITFSVDEDGAHYISVKDHFGQEEITWVLTDLYEWENIIVGIGNGNI